MKPHSSKIQNILFSETLMLICVTFAMTNAVPVMNTDKFSHITEIERLGRVEEVVEEENLIEDMMEERRNCSYFPGYACVPHFQCSNNGKVITDGAGLMDVRSKRSVRAEDGKCPGLQDVCCLEDPDLEPPPAPLIIKKKYQPKCGRRNVHGVGSKSRTPRSELDTEAEFGEWPHMCMVLHDPEPNAKNYLCGASLIAPGALLTSANCVAKYLENGAVSQLKVRCGEWDAQRRTETETLPHQDRQVSSLAIHPEFDGRNLQNDFAVLFTSDNFLLDQHIDTACLPDAGEVFDGTSCFATGWGKDEFGAAGQYQVVLKEIELPVVNHAVCQDTLRTTRLGQKYKLHDSFLCAGGVAGRDTCKGDGGSPLVCPSKQDPDTYVQAGIVAWGIGCGENNVPGVYADVSKATCWIDQQLTCYYGAQTGDYNSYFSYTSNVCGAWHSNKITELTQKMNAAGNNQRFRAIFQNMINEYC